MEAEARDVERDVFRLVDDVPSGDGRAEDDERRRAGADRQARRAAVEDFDDEVVRHPRRVGNAPGLEIDPRQRPRLTRSNDLRLPPVELAADALNELVVGGRDRNPVALVEHHRGARGDCDESSDCRDREKFPNHMMPLALTG
jgi:hypothetical protein